MPARAPSPAASPPSSPPRPPLAAPVCALVEDEEAARSERLDVERRRFWLLKMPQLYAPKHRQRYVFLDLDNTSASLLMSRSLFRAIDGAQCPHDARLNFEALTDHLCGSAVVMHQLATYSKTSPAIAHALENRSC
ncbi:Mitochondrial inner membrane protease ATP23 [Phytophthora cinnamomi]|uniref:Mitochondrial inner membrane protease ATP23 n=1 Tax=Phytophthora cinnamomi TaxID=4785 RepID=UPI003559B489|nr:Mitochondrial inner membrane protease ATP23 [Phytophthora cinnamomi]